MVDRHNEHDPVQPDPGHDEWSAWLPHLEPPTTTPAPPAAPGPRSAPPPTALPPSAPPPTLPPSAWAPRRQPYASPFAAAPQPGAQRPPSWMGWALLSLLVCFPLGIVAVIKAASVNTHWVLGRVDAARRASRSARRWCAAAVVVWMFSWFVLGSVARGFHLLH